MPLDNGAWVFQISRMRRLISIALLVLAWSGSPGLAALPSSTNQWEADIRSFEAADKTNPPVSGGIVFVGSSSIRLWKSLAVDFKGFPVLNRGFGGSQLSDCVWYADRIVLPYHPRQVVVYAGDNDLAAGKSPDQVFEAFEALVKKVHSALPDARISYISVKPSPARSTLLSQMRVINQRIADFIRGRRNREFIDVFNPMLRADGQPRPEIFAADKLHLNAQGYQLWTELVRPHLLR